MMVSVCASLTRISFYTQIIILQLTLVFFNNFTSQIYSVIHVLVFIYLLKFPSPTYNTC